MDIQKSIRMASDTGNVLFGHNSSVQSITQGKTKLVLIAKNVSKDVMVEVTKKCKLAEVPYYLFEGTSMELGSICGKPYPISVMSVLEEGDSDILELVK